jgi:hypothetical protein
VKRKDIPERPTGVPPPYPTEWEYLYEERTAECVIGKLETAFKPQPLVWSASGPLTTRWNPGSANDILTK